MLRSFLMQKKIEKNLKRRFLYTVPFKNTALLFDSHFAIDKAYIKKLSKLIRIPYEDVDVLYFSEKDIHPDFTTVLKNHINWLGNITEPNIKKFLSKQYDLLIDLSKLDNLEKKLVSSGIQAGFRVGISPDELSFYDLIILNEGDLKGFAEELQKYFKALNFLG